MAPRSRLLDLERHDLSLFGAGHSDRVGVAIQAIVVWPVFLAAVLLQHLAAPARIQHAAAVCAALCGAYYCLLLDRYVGALDALLCWAASGYEPYPCSDAKVSTLAEEARKERGDKKAKKMA